MSNINVEVSSREQKGYSVTLPSLGTVYLPSFCELVDITDDEKLVVRLTNFSWHTLDINKIQLEKNCLYQYDGVDFIKLEKDANNIACDELHQLWPITNGLIRKNENGYEAIDLNVECVGPFEDYRTFGDCKTTFALKKPRDGWAFVNVEKNTIGEFKYFFDRFNSDYVFADDRLPVRDITAKYGYVDIFGNEVIECKFYHGYSFDGGIAVVELSRDAYNIIDIDGNQLFDQSFFEAINLGCGICALRDRQDDNLIRVVNAFSKETLFVGNSCAYLDKYLYKLKKDGSKLTAILDVRTQKISDFKYDELWQNQKSIPFVVGFLPCDSSGDCSAEIIDSDGKVIGTSRYSILRNNIQLFLSSGIIVTKNLYTKRGFRQDTFSLSNWKTGKSDSNIYDSYTISKNGKYIILSGEGCFKCITVDNKEIGSSIDGYIVNLHVNTLWVASEYVTSNPEATKNEMLTSLQNSAQSTISGGLDKRKCRRLVRSSIGHAHPEPLDYML